jgi:polygalacturonase
MAISHLVALLALLSISVSSSQRTAHLPRPELERPGAGAAEGPIGATSALFDTVSVGTRAPLPPTVPAGASFLFTPKGSSATVANGAFTPDVCGDYVLPLASSLPLSASPSSSLCDDPSPALLPSTTSLRWAAWDFDDAATVAGEIFADAFSYGGVASSESRYELWAGAVPPGSPVPSCATEANGALTLNATAGGGACTIATRAALVNAFAEPVAVSLSGVAAPTAAAGGELSLSLVDAYFGAANISLLLRAGSFKLSSSGKWLAGGPTAAVCSGPPAGAAFDVSVAAGAANATVTISCSGGAPGTPINAEGAAHGLHYMAFGAPASGAMRVELAGTGAVVRGISAVTTAAASKAPFETAPIGGRGAFARIRLGASQPRAPMGVVDATAPPFSADVSGATPATSALQRALDFCYIHSCTVSLPMGTYIVDDTLNLTQLHDLAQEGVIREAGALHRHWNYHLVGQQLNASETARRAAVGSPTRATLSLPPATPGFTDPATAKAVVWSVSLASAGVDQPNINYCNVVTSLDIVIGAGNFGAVGMRMRGAQGTSVEDVTVFAGDGAVGVHGLGGSGGTHSNITIVGGRFGIDGRVGQPAPTLNAVRVIGARCAGIIACGAQTFTLVGAYMEMAAGVPAVVAGNPIPVAFPAYGGEGDCVLPTFLNDTGPSYPALDGHLVLVDALLNFTGQPPTNNATAPIVVTGSAVLANVFVANAAPEDGTVVSVVGRPARAYGCGTAGCGYVVALLATGGDDFPPFSTPDGNMYVVTDPVYVGGSRVPNGTVLNATSLAPGASLPAGAMADASRHSYSARAFPTFEWLRGAPGAAMCAWDLGVAGDSTDEGAALQHAIDVAAAAGAALVLPRGAYVTSVGLVVPPGFALVGVARTQTALVASPSGLTRGAQSDAAYAPAILYAAPAPAARPRAGSGDEPPLGTVVAFLAVYALQALDNVTNVMLSSPGADAAGNPVLNIWRQLITERLGVDQLTFAAGPAPSPPMVTAQRPMIVFGGTAGTSSWHVQVLFQDEVGAPPTGPGPAVALQGARYRHVLVANARDVRFYHLNLEHAYSDANGQVENSTDIDIFSFKTEMFEVGVWARNASRLRVWGHGGNAAALPANTTERRTIGPDYADSLPSLYRLEACADCLLANLFHQNGGDTEPPDAWHMCTFRDFVGAPDNSSWTATDFLERPTLVLT